jgi:hypothetical protein
MAQRAAQTGNDDASGWALLARWGYAYVFDSWRFHMTLSDRFSERQSPAAMRLEYCARIWFSRGLAQPLRCTSLCIFHEARAGEPFHLLERLPLNGAV